jgi:hypothetical protein
VIITKGKVGFIEPMLAVAVKPAELIEAVRELEHQRYKKGTRTLRFG